MLTMAFISQMLTEWGGIGARILRLKLKFSSMVYPEDIVVCEGSVTSVCCFAGETSVGLVVAARDQAEEILVTGEAEMLFEG